MSSIEVKYLVDDAGLQVHEESPGDVFACACGGEEGGEGGDGLSLFGLTDSPFPGSQQ